MLGDKNKLKTAFRQAKCKQTHKNSSHPCANPWFWLSPIDIACKCMAFSPIVKAFSRKNAPPLEASAIFNLISTLHFKLRDRQRAPRSKSASERVFQIQL